MMIPFLKFVTVVITFSCKFWNSNLFNFFNYSDFSNNTIDSSRDFLDTFSVGQFVGGSPRKLRRIWLWYLKNYSSLKHVIVSWIGVMYGKIQLDVMMSLELIKVAVTFLIWDKNLESQTGWPVPKPFWIPRWLPFLCLVPVLSNFFQLNIDLLFCLYQFETMTLDCHFCGEFYQRPIKQ